MTNEDFATARLDHRLSGRDRLAGSYRFDDARFHAPDSLNTQLVGSTTRNQTAVVEESRVLGTAALNSLRFGINRSVADNNQSENALLPAAADVSFGATPGRTSAGLIVPGLTSFVGGLGGSGTYLFHTTSLQLYDDLSQVRGRHSLKLGSALERLRDNIQAFGLPNGQFQFGSLSGFLRNQPTKIYRIAGEALRNAFRHAEATQVVVEIRYDRRQFRVRVRDNGKGIDAELLQNSKPGHWGLVGMRERARLIGGGLEVWSDGGIGTEVELILPSSLAYSARSSGRWFRLFSATTELDS